MLTILGEHPLAKDKDGKLKSRIATIFPHANTLVTLPGIHATQRMAFVDLLDQQRTSRREPPMSADERSAQWEKAVDLVIEDNAILIRPDPDNMPLAFKGDEILQELVSKERVKFLFVVNQRVREALKRRGECWRLASLPRSPDEMKQLIATSRIGIRGKEIYYFGKATGTRFLTFHEFAQLGTLDDDELRKYLIEVKTYSARINRLGCPEISFLGTDRSFSKATLAPCDFAALAGADLQDAFETLRRGFAAAVRPALRHDDPENVEWRNAAVAAILGQADQAVPEEILLGLSSEFFMQIEWLPGARIEEGEVLFDSALEENVEGMGGRELQRAWAEKARGLVFNFIREYGDLEYINIGRIVSSLSKRPAYQGRRDVYVAEMKTSDSPKEIVKIIRMQKWGVREHLDDGKNLLEAILESEAYTEYILDRRLGCRQIGMNLTPRIVARKIGEMYYGKRGDRPGILIWSPYFEREYVHGIATDKLPPFRFESEEFALRFARCLGWAAAPNIIVGRCDLNGRVVFDDGDEVIVEDAEGMPVGIVVADHTSTFVDYGTNLRRFAAEYAGPMNRRAAWVARPPQFFHAYLDAFLDHFCRIQAEYRKRKRGFDTLFKHQHKDPAGNFAYRWEQVLERLNRTDPHELQDLIRQNLDLPQPRPEPEPAHAS